MNYTRKRMRRTHEIVQFVVLGLLGVSFLFYIFVPALSGLQYALPWFKAAYYAALFSVSLHILGLVFLISGFKSDSTNNYKIFGWVLSIFTVGSFIFGGFGFLGPIYMMVFLSLGLIEVYQSWRLLLT